ncbi:hypothetical protein CEXT_350071 [Caerostris extrusa]|uniref:Uncharacterized protein n=1 Tax=Caerostris extrusa TaxID=172846 RepID=A0AAV4P496_CAEEX|nr:hypothetical protein CEXT_350071 [Caerostris extrusa]
MYGPTLTHKLHVPMLFEAVPFNVWMVVVNGFLIGPHFLPPLSVDAMIATSPLDFQERFSVNLWVSIVNDFQLNHTGLHIDSTYHAFLEEIVPEFHDNVLIVVRNPIGFPNDGDTVHFCTNWVIISRFHSDGLSEFSSALVGTRYFD